MSTYDKQKEVLSVLADTTYENPMPARDIAELMNIKAEETSPQVRSLIFKAMQTFQIPVGSCRLGYYIIRTAHEMQRYLNSLLQRQIGITNRIDVVYKAFHNDN